MSQNKSKCASLSSHTAAATTSSSHAPSLLERIRALDKSAELSHRYTPLVLFHPNSSNSDHDTNVTSSGYSSLYVAVGHAETSFVDSTLLHCKDENGDPIFVKDQLPNESGVMAEVLRLYMDIQTQKDIVRRSQEGSGYNGNAYNHTKFFQKRTLAFEHVTNHLLSAGVISRKHADRYPIYPFLKLSPIDRSGSEHNQKVVLAHVNRSTAPYLGIDSLGVHLHCYVCRCGELEGEGLCDNNNKPPIKGLWLQKRAPTKSHHPNCWDPTAAGGQPDCLSLIDNVVKEAQEEAGVPPEWISDTTNTPDIRFSDHTHDPLTITTAKQDGTCLKRSFYYSCDLQVPHGWTPIPIDGEVSEFKLYSMQELEEELRFGNIVRPAMRAVLLDFMIRHDVLKGEQNIKELRDAMRRERLILW